MLYFNSNLVGTLMTQLDQSEIYRGFAFSKIHIVQSLKPRDRKTGVDLLRFLENIPDTEGHLAFKDVRTRPEFLGCLDEIRDQLRLTGEIPLLQFEVHGCPTGLELTSGEFVEWSELKDVLTEINVLCKLNLLVVMSACYGDCLVRMVRVSERSPVWGCLGPRESISGDDLIDAFKAFFARLLAGDDVREALASIDAGLPAAGKPFVLWPAEYFFLTAYRGYLATQCTEQELGRRTEQILQHLVLAPGGRIEVADGLRNQIRSNLGAHEHFFVRHREIFFMEDLYPGHAERFDARFSTIFGTLGEDDTKHG